MMKKKILFIISNLQTGGVSKAMTSLLNVIDRERYDVSLMAVSASGPFMELLPKDLRIITNPVWTDVTSGFKGTLDLIKKGQILLASGTLLRFLSSRLSKSLSGILMAKMMPPVSEEFDTIVDFNGQQQCYYMVDKLKARKKVTFFHSDYSKWPYYYSADKKYYPKVDRIFTISEECVLSLQKYFPEQKSKIALMQNISSAKLIDEMSKQPCEGFAEGFKFLTIGHVIKPKGFDLATEAARILKERGVKFSWYFIGAVPDTAFALSFIEKNEVCDRIELMGVKVNPYPYISQADLIVHPSRFEGKSIALDEAKLLCKPIVVTNFSTVRDQFTDRHDASICEMKPESIADAIQELLENESLRRKYSANLLSERKDNSDEIEKLYEIFDD